MHFETATLAWFLFGSLAFIAMSAFMGDHHDVDAGADMGHDGMDAGTDAHQGVSASELFNPRNLALFIAGFCGASIIARNAGYDEFVSNVAGISGATAMFVTGIWLFRVVRRQESNSLTSYVDLVGKTAFVTTGIPEGGFGEITLPNSYGVSASLTAKTNGPVIPAGTEVRITAIAGNIATVVSAAH